MDDGVKFPKWNGSLAPSTHLFFLACFVVGFAVITALSLGQIKYDDREVPGWNPISKLPDGKTGLSEFVIGTIGFAVLGVGLALIAGMALDNNSIQQPIGDYTIKSN